MEHLDEMEKRLRKVTTHYGVGSPKDDLMERDLFHMSVLMLKAMRELETENRKLKGQLLRLKHGK